MAGTPITQQQVNLYMSYRKNPKHSQVSSAAKAGFSERTARRIDKGEHESHRSVRKYRTREDPFNGLFEKYIVPLLLENPALQPITLLEVLVEKAPDKIDQSQNQWGQILSLKTSLIRLLLIINIKRFS